jgi:hypothetical protein
MTSRRFTAAPILAVLAIGVPLLLLGAYVGGYFWLGEWLHGGPVPMRYYRYRWQASVFMPAAKIESYLRASSINVTSQAEIDELIYSPPPDQTP